MFKSIPQNSCTTTASMLQVSANTLLCTDAKIRHYQYWTDNSNEAAAPAAEHIIR
jgi:hypothetical protein